jgi:hypothetical protein
VLSFLDERTAVGPNVGSVQPITGGKDSVHNLGDIFRLTESSEWIGAFDHVHEGVGFAFHEHGSFSRTGGDDRYGDATGYEGLILSEGTNSLLNCTWKMVSQGMQGWEDYGPLLAR